MKCRSTRQFQGSSNSRRETRKEVYGTADVRAIMQLMSGIQNAVSTPLEKEYGDLALRISAAFCLAFRIFWESRTGKISSELTRNAFWVFPYILVVVHPRRWRDALLGVALGFPSAAALLAVLVSGFARSKEAHVPYLAFPYANLLMVSIAIRSWLAERKSIRAGLILGFAIASFAYMWVVVSI